MSKDVKFNIRLSVDGKDQVVTATASVKDMAKSIANVQAAVEKNATAFNKWKDSAMAVSGTITAIQSMRGALSDLTAESNQFTAAMKEANTMAGKDGAGFQQLKEQVSELSESIPIARDALAKGLYQVISNGVPEDNWMSYLEKSAKASVGGLADLQEVVKVASERQVAAVDGFRLTGNVLPYERQVGKFGYVCRSDAAVVQLFSALHGHTRIFRLPFDAEETPSAQARGNPGRR